MSGQSVRERWPQKEDVFPLYLVCIVEWLKRKRLGTTEELGGRSAGRHPLLVQLPAPQGSPGSLPGPACRARHPPGRRHGTAPPRPPRAALPPAARTPLPLPALLRGRGWGGGGRRRRREEIGGATPAAHWLPRPGARSPASLAGSRDPFQRWPPCCFDE